MQHSKQISNTSAFLSLGICNNKSFLLLVAKSCLILCDPMNCQGPLSFTISQSLLKSIELVTLSNHLILCHPLLLLSLVFPSIRAFSSESVLYIRWPKYWSFSFSISPSKEYWFLLGLTYLISQKPKGLSRVFSNTTKEWGLSVWLFGANTWVFQRFIQALFNF